MAQWLSGCNNDRPLEVTAGVEVHRPQDQQPLIAHWKSHGQNWRLEYSID